MQPYADLTIRGQWRTKTAPPTIWTLQNLLQQSGKTADAERGTINQIKALEIKKDQKTPVRGIEPRAPRITRLKFRI